MRYSIEAPAAGRWTATIGARSAQGGTLALGDRPIALAASPTWQELTIADIALPAGRTPLTLRTVTCADRADESLSFAPHSPAEPPPPPKRPASPRRRGAKNGHTE